MLFFLIFTTLLMTKLAFHLLYSFLNTSGKQKFISGRY